MRMKSTGIWPLELIGNITEVKTMDDWLIMHLRTTTPAGWDLRAALTHEDLRTLFKLLLKPSNLRYLILGFVRPLRNEPPPEY
jgi:hypothetical protein